MQWQVELTSVFGDQVEYADLLGSKGTLALSETSNSSELNWFMPDNSGDTLSLSKKMVLQDQKTITVETRLNNTFVFTIIPVPVKRN